MVLTWLARWQHVANFGQPKRLGEYLQKAGCLTKAQLKTAIDIQQQQGGKFGHILLQLRFVNRHQLRQAIAHQWLCQTGATGLWALFTLVQMTAPSQAKPSAADFSTSQTITETSENIVQTHAAGFPANTFWGFADEKHRSNDQMAGWVQVKDTVSQEENDQTANDCTETGDFCLPNAWLGQVEALKNLPLSQQLAAVNDFVNTYAFKSDRDNYHRRDYWATPVEFVQHHGGDCEDYAIAKLALLEAAGVDTDQMRILVLEQTRDDFRHAVLVVQNDNDWVVLDNLQKTVKTAAELPYYQPIYSINAHAWWLHQSPFEATGNISTAGN